MYCIRRPTGNVQGSVSCYNLETKQVVTRRTITLLPMPDRVIRRVLKLGERCKQKRVSERIQFLNRNKEQFSWGDGTEEDGNEGLVEQEPHKSDTLPAELPGVDLEEDHEAVAALQEAPTSDAEIAQAALQNANLQQATDAPEIAGVDLPEIDPPSNPPAVTDDEADEDDDKEDSLDDDSAPDFGGGGVKDVGDNTLDLLGDEDSQQGQEVGTNEQDNLENSPEDALSDTDLTGAVRRRSRRIQKNREPTVIDFQNRAYSVQDGVLHINPNVLDQAQEDTKITSDVLNPRQAPRRYQYKYQGLLGYHVKL